MSKSIGYLLMIAATVCYSLLYPLFKKGGEKILPFTAMALSMFVLFSTSLVLSIIFENSQSLKFLNQKNGFTILIIAGFVNVLGFWFLLNAYKYMPVWQVALFALFYPVLGGIFAYFILGEALSYKLFIGLFIMSIGLYIAIK